MLGAGFPFLVRPLAPGFQGNRSRHRLARLHTKQDPRPISPAEAATDRLRKLEDPGGVEKFVSEQKSSLWSIMQPTNERHET
jgi:hypothetical protein